MFSVIIPTLNEEAYILDTLRSVPADKEPVELIVADGGSSDGTKRRAAAHARVVDAPRGRACQMNAGAEAAGGNVLVFLHADTQLPPDAFSSIRSALRDSSIEGGAFRLRFDHTSPVLRFYAFCTRVPLPQICFGDRALFVRRSVFDELQGFPNIPIFEDLEMVRLLHRRGGFSFLNQQVTTSARRFVRVGPIRQQLQNFVLWGHFMLRTPPGDVAHRYGYGEDIHTSSAYLTDGAPARLEAAAHR